ncbi:hypothetical protein IW16_16415 [Chryseobacterium vrystaatense]|uniref:Uncharacterized protein n=1 Tax=Chryseobacterium vrystaatense TaxID=307480 RepID=A0ABR4ULI7_9FLAO|nr:hypothetical protein IW16_16415 [Chryseobacterium vrystaatense]
MFSMLKSIYFKSDKTDGCFYFHFQYLCFGGNLIFFSSRAESVTNVPAPFRKTNREIRVRVKEKNNKSLTKIRACFHF